MPWARPGAGSSVSMSRGTTITARTPPYADCRSETCSLYICVSRPTTAMPSRGAVAEVVEVDADLGLARACPRPGARASSLRLTPASSISMATPVCTSTAVTCTLVCGGE